MVKKIIDENLEEDIKIPVAPIQSGLNLKKGKEVRYKKDRTGWVVLPFAFLLALVCVFSVFLSISNDPSGGIAGRTLDSVLEAISSFKLTSDTVAGDDTGESTVTPDALEIEDTLASGGGVGSSTSMGSIDLHTQKSVLSFISRGSINLFSKYELISNQSDGQIDINTLTRSSINSGVSLKSMMKGSWEDRVYSNQYAGFTLTLVDNWVRESEGESYIISTEDVVGAYIVNKTNGDNILIRFFNMAVTTGGQDVYEDDFLEGMKRMGEQDESLNAVFGNVFQISIGSNQYKGIEESIEGVINLYYLARRIGDYMSIISIKSDGELETILKMFN